MMLRKQTVWLLTMLAVMVVLSGYYLIKGPENQVPALGQEQLQQPDPLAGVVVESKETDKPAPDAAAVEGKGSQTDSAVLPESTAKETLTLTDTPSEIFTGYKMKREAQTQQQKDEQLTIMGSPDATPQAVAEAKSKYEELSNLESATMAAEEMLKASGYKDAVVFAQNDKVTVIVQKEKLSAEEAVDIISNVKQHLNVPANHVTVQFKAS
ncbi:SpoIIIAH-like family protein [Brevibacillus ruminantium]|uniref:SpoIIIAH-like family protein n=1 Tax=Brevibacillus ruminantium TaxID=2950604 RepID=A0ABY4W9Y0_9BACL|nr:SpoIIIAH-like family protein [Brevibacillus ruminantium]USG63646.1 SpoIIIAH-like family protein [Brevibacillus ruminantium]